ncbi:hypothetical protein [[Clostridium] fimetarium]|uniref:Uncharacterized protein n=1 Tax=[Clostridium] fimetarium TaxID=99656 RepID=A0A1I0Q5L6_9FIRM|nr:hypothetical protein [[Clostridium] fimetarium]SEW22169.1 hypothetical protein SAMN05421659_1074 [[Clostridium] fimetarium]
MSEIIKGSNAFVGYEYKEVITNKEKVSFQIDGYKNFGWEVDDNIKHNMSVNVPRNIPSSYGTVVLWLKRDRKIMNKMELTRLQRNFEFCIKEIIQLESSKTSTATMYAIIVGIIGTAFMAGSVFAVTAAPPMIVLSIILAIPAFAGWISPYYIYNMVVRKRAEKVSPLIEEKRDEVYEICEKGSKLLY